MSSKENFSAYLIKLLWGLNAIMHKRCSISLTHSGRSLDNTYTHSCLFVCFFPKEAVYTSETNQFC